MPPFSSGSHVLQRSPQVLPTQGVTCVQSCSVHAQVPSASQKQVLHSTCLVSPSSQDLSSQVWSPPGVHWPSAPQYSITGGQAPPASGSQVLHASPQVLPAQGSSAEQSAVSQAQLPSASHTHALHSTCLVSPSVQVVASWASPASWGPASPGPASGSTHPIRVHSQRPWSSHMQVLLHSSGRVSPSTQAPVSGDSPTSQPASPP